MQDKRWTLADKYHMKQALKLAEQGYGRVSPNPYVGAVIVKDGRIIGQGHHHQHGQAHAEIHALADAKSHYSDTDIRGATLYVTLEPCCHVGHTGACTKAIVEAGIARVVSAMEDPNPKVQGKGHACLLQHGVDVSTGLLAGQAQHLNRHFVHNQLTQRPFITLKAALSLDGKLATSTGDSQWITCKQARKKAHYLRGLHDGILIGKGTLMADNPSLTVRYGYGDKTRAPLRVVLLTDFNGIDATFKLFDTSNAPTLVLTSDEALTHSQWQPLFRRLSDQGVQILSLPNLSAQAVVTLLNAQRVNSIMLEGGAQIYNDFLQGGCVIELALFYGPRLIGGKGAYQLWLSNDIQVLENAPVLSIYQTEQVGQSVFVNAFFQGE